MRSGNAKGLGLRQRRINRKKMGKRMTPTTGRKKWILFKQEEIRSVP